VRDPTIASRTMLVEIIHSQVVRIRPYIHLSTLALYERLSKNAGSKVTVRTCRKGGKTKESWANGRDANGGSCTRKGETRRKRKSTYGESTTLVKLWMIDTWGRETERQITKARRTGRLQASALYRGEAISGQRKSLRTMGETSWCSTSRHRRG